MTWKAMKRLISDEYVYCYNNYVIEDRVCISKPVFLFQTSEPSFSLHVRKTKIENMYDTRNHFIDAYA